MPTLQNEVSKNVHFISLGCARNRVDTEVMLGTMALEGWTAVEEPEGADAIIVNTCGFIGPAKEESIDTILEMAEIKEDNPNTKLVVTGCLTQRYKGQLAKGLPEVDFFVGTDEFPKVAQYLNQHEESSSNLGSKTHKKEPAVFAQRSHYIYSDDMPRTNTLSSHSAYVKVAEGCQHNCAFCIIPAIRGRLRSRPLPSVVKEVEKLGSEGVREINLIAQDLAAYGREKGEHDLYDLLSALVKVPSIEWIRMLYFYPEYLEDRFLDLLRNEPKIVKYLDIPVQHASDSVLKAMKRNVTGQELREKLARLREKVPGVAIRTSVMVGFPGETDEDFQELLDFVKVMKFDHLGCFSYSQEEGTVAGRMKDQIPEEVKEERLAKIMAAQKEISMARLEALVGTETQILIEGPCEDTPFVWKGRMPSQAPEVDGFIYITDTDPDLLEAGKMAQGKIVEASEYDLVARLGKLVE